MQESKSLQTVWAELNGAGEPLRVLWEPENGATPFTDDNLDNYSKEVLTGLDTIQAGNTAMRAVDLGRTFVIEARQGGHSNTRNIVRGSGNEPIKGANPNPVVEFDIHFAD